nr:nuclear transport factor 2 family protein [Lysinibacillus timonensis]
MNKMIIALLAAILLTACGNKEQEVNMKETEQIIEEGTVGFEVMGENIEEAADVPSEEKKAIISVFDEYIASFNSKDIDRYVATLSKNPQGFSIEEDKAAAEAAFEQYDIKKTPSEITIVKYSDEQAQVYANVLTETKEIASGNEFSDEGRQVTVLVKEDGEWKVTSIYYIGNQS